MSSPKSGQFWRCKIKYKINDRVYYTENGASDTGTIEDVTEGVQCPYLVRWDQKIYPDDPELDRFAEHQLTLCS